ncbi:MAG: DUF3144 domain-containing protein [Gammaproteobacteria bacterium]|nr:DUF3144 domain-containing protein [Gammaproteobacteria bacterium]MCW8887738.1 DUF3144 domain-containing protein [Gammaproteobacteria bacterium]
MSSTTEPDEQFWEMADSFIKLANEQSQNIDPNKVDTAMRYASARFSANIVASHASDAEAIKADKEKATKHFSDQYQQMFSDNLEDYEINFDAYAAKANPS